MGPGGLHRLPGDQEGAEAGERALILPLLSTGGGAGGLAGLINQRPCRLLLSRLLSSRKATRLLRLRPSSSARCSRASIRQAGTVVEMRMARRVGFPSNRLDSGTKLLADAPVLRGLISLGGGLSVQRWLWVSGYFLSGERGVQAG